MFVLIHILVQVYSRVVLLSEGEQISLNIDSNARIELE